MATTTGGALPDPDDTDPPAPNSGRDVDDIGSDTRAAGETDGSGSVVAFRSRPGRDDTDTPDRPADEDRDGDETTDESVPDGADDDGDDEQDDDEDDDQSSGDGPRRVLVDSTEAQRGPSRWDAWRSVQRLPILPGWLRSWHDFADTLVWASGYVGHRLAYHGLRVPKYVLRLVGRAPRGAGRLVAGVVGWTFDLQGERVCQQMASKPNMTREDTEQFLRLKRQRDVHVRWRGMVTAALAVPTVAAVIAVWFAPMLWQATVAAALTVLCGVVGRPADRPLLDTAVVKPSYRPLTSDELVHALGALGIGQINQAIAKHGAKAFGWVAPIRTDGPGWRVDMDLPGGVTVGEVADRREKLAAALGRPLGCVWPEGNPDEHPGRLVLWVGQQDMSKARQPAWPLAKAGTVDLFKPQPFGTDPRGRWVTITLAYASMVIGSVPRMGKTFALRELLLLAALDPRTEVHAYDLKGTGDLEPLAAVAHRYRAGDDPADIAYAVDAMAELQEELRRRTTVVRGLPREVCPDKQVTSELASDRKLRLHPAVIGVDECQRWFEHPQYGEMFKEICVDLAKRGPAVGLWLILATQQPKDSSLPIDIAQNAVLRFCLKVMDHMANDLVLGSSMYKNGIRATMFSRKKDKGIGYLVGEEDDPCIVRTVGLDMPASDKIAARARAARERAGTLTGHALGEQPTTPTRTRRLDSLLEDILTVCPPAEGTGKFWTEVILDRLAGHDPEAYDELSRDELNAALRRQGITGQQVWGKPADGKSPNRAGFDTRQIAEAVAERNRKRGGPAAA